MLSNPDFSKPFVVQVDASNRGIGAVLSQTDDSGEEHPIAYLSRKLAPREINYSTIERECLGIIWAIQSLRHYLFGKQFMVQTDHHPLRWLLHMKDKNQRLLRWSLILQEYSFDIVHQKGTANGNADGLSRAWAN